MEERKGEMRDGRPKVGRGFYSVSIQICSSKERIEKLCQNADDDDDYHKVVRMRII